MGSPRTLHRVVLGISQKPQHQNSNLNYPSHKFIGKEVSTYVYRVFEYFYNVRWDIVQKRIF